jgi:hypothetical protein
MVKAISKLPRTTITTMAEARARVRRAEKNGESFQAH